MVYLYGLLRQDISDEAVRHNNKWLGPNTLGIEVTSSFLARRCGLGNIDPQHQIDGKSSAIEEALTFPLPEEGSKMVTIRPDKDSVGAMAVLTLRAQGRVSQVDKFLVSWIGALDRHGYENAVRINPELASLFRDSSESDALNVICLNRDLWPNLADRVLQAGYILSREMSASELQRIRAMRSRGVRNFTFTRYGNIAFLRVSGVLYDARNWANRRFPVAVIYDDCHKSHESHGGTMHKWSVIRQPHYFDRQGFELAVNVAEARARGMTPDELSKAGLAWGGTTNIISSPQGVGRESVLSTEMILTIVKTHLESGVVS